MSSAFNTNPNRASLLAGLRTGGVRPPQSAAPTAAGFDPQQLQIPQQQYHQNRGFVTAAVDGPNNSFAAQQQVNPYQLQQAMQLEMLKLQAIQAQQYQAEILRQQQLAQQQQQQQQQQQRRAVSFQPPATAGPTGQFDLRSATLNAQMRRTQAAQLAPANNDAVPMTARLDGKFGTRSTSMPMAVPPSPNTHGATTVISGGTSLGAMAANNANAAAAKEPAAPSKSDSASTWRRGGSNSALQAIRDRAVTSPAVKVAPPALKKERASPPPGLSTPPVTAGGASKRPKPLSFSITAQQPMIPSVLIDTSEADEEVDDASSTSGSSRSSNGNGSGKSSPTTSNELLSTLEVNIMQPPLSPREEASKKLYEGLGIGRPRSRNSDSGDVTPPSPRSMSVNMAPPQTAALFPSHAHSINANSFPQSPFSLPPMPHTASLSGPNYMQHRLDRSANQPKRQPRGPPSGADELGPVNFAARSARLPPTAGFMGSMQNLVIEAY